MIAVALAALVVVGIGTSEPAQRRYHVWRVRALLRDCNPLLQKGDFGGFGKTCDEIEQVMRRSSPAARSEEMAEIVDHPTDPAVKPFWRAFIVRAYYGYGEILVAELKAADEFGDSDHARHLWSALREHARRIEAIDPTLSGVANDVLETARPYVEKARLKQIGAPRGP
jgi:hypothetical protein